MKVHGLGLGVLCYGFWDLQGMGLKAWGAELKVWEDAFLTCLEAYYGNTLLVNDWV